MIRKATQEDIRVIDGLQEFIESLELDILSYCSEEKLREVLKFVFLSEEDRFSYKNCTVCEIE